MSYVVDLEAYYGPLDLLLYLIEKNQMDIYDIPIHIITDQYMEHIQSIGGSLTWVRQVIFWLWPAICSI